MADHELPDTSSEDPMFQIGARSPVTWRDVWASTEYAQTAVISDPQLSEDPSFQTPVESLLAQVEFDMAQVEDVQDSLPIDWVAIKSFVGYVLIAFVIFIFVIRPLWMALRRWVVARRRLVVGVTPTRK